MSVDVQRFVNDLLTLSTRGVKWVHQGRDPDIGVDCIGALRWAYMQQRDALPEELEREFDAYERRPDGDKLMSIMRGWFDEGERTDRQFGDLLVIYDRTNPQHMAVMVSETDVFEAYSSPISGVEKCLRQRLDKRRVVAAVFRFPTEGEKADKWQR